jgi:hypothetical protein
MKAIFATVCLLALASFGAKRPSNLNRKSDTDRDWPLNCCGTMPDAFGGP